MNILVPTTYNDSLAATICEQIAQGVPATTVCKAPGFPPYTTLIVWMNEHPEFLEAMARADKSRAEVLIDDSLTIADDATEDWRTVTHKGGGTSEVFNHEHATRSKLRVETRWKLAKCLNRDRFGDNKKLDIEAKVLTMHLTDEVLNQRLIQATRRMIDITP